MCAVCHDVCVEPVQLPCQHLFCVQCISSSVSAARAQEAQCPVCRQSFRGGEVEVSRPIWNFLGKLTVACEFAEHGCGSTHTVSEAAQHSAECAFRPQKCRWCPQRYRLEELADHEGNCDRRPVECPRCNASVAHSDLETRIHACTVDDPTVPHYCRHRALGCGWQGQRSEEEAHLPECWSEQGKDVLHGLVSRILELEQHREEDILRWERVESRLKQEIEMKNEVILRMVASMEMRLTDQITSLLAEPRHTAVVAVPPQAEQLPRINIDP